MVPKAGVSSTMSWWKSFIAAGTSRRLLATASICANSNIRWPCIALLRSASEGSTRQVLGLRQRAGGRLRLSKRTTDRTLVQEAVARWEPMIEPKQRAGLDAVVRPGDGSGPAVSDQRLLRGARSRRTIVRHAVDVASLEGLNGLS